MFHTGTQGWSEPFNLGSLAITVYFLVRVYITVDLANSKLTLTQ